MKRAVKKSIVLLTNILLLGALLTGCTLARPVATENGGDTFCGFWLIYDRLTSTQKHVFNMNDPSMQVLLGYYGQVPEQETASKAWQAKFGSAIAEGEQHLNVKNDNGVSEETFEVKGTVYLLDEYDRSLEDEIGRQIWMYEDVVQTFRDLYIDPPEGVGREDVLAPGESVIVYISQAEIDAHGAELEKIAQEAGVRLILKNESPREMRVVSVYQRPDGSMYADEDSMKHILNADASLFMSVEHKQTDSGRDVQKEKVSITISAKLTDALKSVQLVEMDGENRPLRTTAVTKETLQALSLREKSYESGQDAAYVIVEETYATKTGESYIKRTAYSPGKAGDTTRLMHAFHFPLGNGLTETVTMNIAYPKAK